MTAANSSSISDGAAALVLARGDVAAKRGLKPIARIVAQASHAGRAALVHHRAGRRDPKGVETGRLEERTMSICSRSTKPSPTWR